MVSSTEKDTILLDCVTVLITNILMEDEKDFDKLSSREIEDLEAQVMMELSNIIKGARDGNRR